MRKKMLKKLGIVGHFAEGKDFFDGQTIKIRTLYHTMCDQLSTVDILTLDTYGGMKSLPKLVIKTFSLFKNSKNIIMLPAQNGLKLFAPLFYACNLFFQRKLHYSVIGGWLPEFVEAHTFIDKILKKFDGIYVETNAMKNALESRGYTNIYIVPNFKNIDILKPEELITNHAKPFSFCTFSRVMKEKGIEEAIQAIKNINNKKGENICSLDVYGKIDDGYLENFKALEKDFPDYVRYRGCIDANASVNVLKNYYALLFPTYYEGEGFAGTLIDAFSSGIPVIASDWRYNSEFVTHGYDGLVVTPKDVTSLSDAIEWLIENQHDYHVIKLNTLQTASRYSSSEAIQIILNNLS